MTSVIDPDTCFECGAPSAHDHHVIPRSRGGSRTVPLCLKCHDLAHDTELLTLAQETRDRVINDELKRDHVPYGKDEIEQRCLAYMKRLESEGRSLHEITDALNASDFYPRLGFDWFPMLVKTILPIKIQDDSSCSSEEGV